MLHVATLMVGATGNVIVRVLEDTAGVSKDSYKFQLPLRKRVKLWQLTVQKDIVMFSDRISQTGEDYIYIIFVLTPSRAPSSISCVT